MFSNYNIFTSDQIPAVASCQLVRGIHYNHDWHHLDKMHMILVITVLHLLSKSKSLCCNNIGGALDLFSWIILVGLFQLSVCLIGLEQFSVFVWQFGPKFELFCWFVFHTPIMWIIHSLLPENICLYNLRDWKLKQSLYLQNI